MEVQEGVKFLFPMRDLELLKLTDNQRIKKDF
jgi:hypothetical protein